MVHFILSFLMLVEGFSSHFIKMKTNVATKLKMMKKLKQSQLIHIWEEYEFYLNIPESFKGSNKPFIFFYQLNAKTNTSERIRRYIGKNDGDTILLEI